jgi:hypothetical protein
MKRSSSWYLPGTSFLIRERGAYIPMRFWPLFHYSSYIPTTSAIILYLFLHDSRAYTREREIEESSGVPFHTMSFLPGPRFSMLINGLWNIEGLLLKVRKYYVNFKM